MHLPKRYVFKWSIIAQTYNSNLFIPQYWFKAWFWTTKQHLEFFFLTCKMTMFQVPYVVFQDPDVFLLLYFRIIHSLLSCKLVHTNFIVQHGITNFHALCQTPKYPYYIENMIFYKYIHHCVTGNLLNRSKWFTRNKHACIQVCIIILNTMCFKLSTCMYKNINGSS